MNIAYDHKLILVQYWARYCILRWNDSPDNPIMDELINEYGVENIEIIDDMFQKHVLGWLPAEIFMQTIYELLFEKHILIRDIDRNQVDVIYWTVFKTLFLRYQSLGLNQEIVAMFGRLMAQFEYDVQIYPTLVRRIHDWKKHEFDPVVINLPQKME